MSRWLEFDAGPAVGETVPAPAPEPADPAVLEMLHATRLATGDTTGAGAAAVAAVTTIWTAGRDFTALGSWIVRIDDLLARAPAPQPLVRATLAQQRLIAGMLGGEALGELLRLVPAARFAADESRSAPLRIVAASLEGALHVLRGDLHLAEECLRDAAPLLVDPRAMPVPQVFLANCAAMIGAVRDLPPAGQALLEAPLPDAASATPPLAALVPLVRCHQLLALARRAPDEAVEAAAASLRTLVVPQADRHLASYLHFALGVGALVRNRPAEALDHARISARYGAWCGSALTLAASALLEAQALADLGKDADALGRLEAVLPRWEAAGYGLFQVAALVECASLHLRAGRLLRARQCAAAARAALPSGAALPDLDRPAGSAARIVERLLPAPAATRWQNGVVSVTVFGELHVCIDGRHIFDRDWHGSRTKCLLKALIVLGGRKVSLARLCDLLWPDAEGDHAQQNLKVALSRLRHLGTPAGVAPLPWVVTQHGQVSLVSALCQVDALRYRDAIGQAAAGDPERLAAALDLYRADFLEHDDSEPWIVAHRALLRREYVRAAQALARSCLAASRAQVAEPYLERAIDLDADDARSYELLIRLHLLSGNDAGIQATCRRAQAVPHLRLSDLLSRR